MSADDSPEVVSLFSGIGGLDRGLEDAGFRIREMCESWAPARRVLAAHYDDVPIAGDVVDFLPAASAAVLAAGFPCTNISHAGDRTGIGGEASGLVRHVFRIAAARRPEWIVLENVPNLLTLHKGAGIAHIVSELEALGYAWAYRTVDSRFTGVPQRRPRVVVVAWRSGNPAHALLSQNVAAPDVPTDAEAWGFYWTEGRHGVGLVPDAVPTLKGGSTLGLPSAPAIWLPRQPAGRRFVLPTISQGERLQGLRAGWTSAAVVDGEPDMRWKLVGNAVTRGVGAWLGSRIVSADDRPWAEDGRVVQRGRRWPDAAWGSDGDAWASAASRFPVRRKYRHLIDIVDPEQAVPLSHRATAGFLSRLAESGIPVNEAMFADLDTHLRSTRPILNPVARRRAHVVPDKDSWASSPATRRRMQATGPRDTKPEVRLRRELFARGLRYRLQTRPEKAARWRMDIVFGPAKVAVDVRGCFWHKCPVHATKPKTNADRWAAKLDANVERDNRIVAALEQLGWHVIVVWEHEDPHDAADRIETAVLDRRPTPTKQ